MLYVSEPIDIISEYRCFVHKGVLKGIKWYAGDITEFPHINIIQEMISRYKDAPVAYTLDVGVIKNEEVMLEVLGCDDTTTALIEVNDFWAIGSYGVSGKIYVPMLIDRFKQICK